jgi:hypothetical protein
MPTSQPLPPEVRERQKGGVIPILKRPVSSI